MFALIPIIPISRLPKMVFDHKRRGRRFFSRPRKPEQATRPVLHEKEEEGRG